MRTDVVHVIRHPPQDGVGHRFLGVAAIPAVAVQLLDPLKIDDGNDADLEVRVLGDVDLVGHDGAVQAFVEQQVGVFRQRTPFGEGAGRRAVKPGFVLVVNVMTRGAGAGLAVVAEDVLQFLEQVGFRAEVAEVLVAVLALFLHPGAHLDAVVAMKRIALDIGCGDLLAAEDVLERLLHRSGAGARRTRDRYDGIAA